MSKISMSDLVKVLKAAGIDAEAILERLQKDDAIELGPAGNPDFIAHGSNEHAALLGLARVENGWQGPQLEGWKLIDPMFTELDSDRITERVLQQRVNELTAPIPQTQSRDRRAPGFAPTLWDPSHGAGRKPFSQITE